MSVSLIIERVAWSPLVRFIDDYGDAVLNDEVDPSLYSKYLGAQNPDDHDSVGHIWGNSLYTLKSVAALNYRQNGRRFEAFSTFADFVINNADFPPDDPEYLPSFSADFCTTCGFAQSPASCKRVVAQLGGAAEQYDDVVGTLETDDETLLERFSTTRDICVEFIDDTTKLIRYCTETGEGIMGMLG